MMVEYWHWVVLGLLMIILEVMAPGAFFLWIGIAAFILGGTLFLLPFTSLTIQLILFGVLAVLSTIGGRRVMRNVTSAAPSLLNRRGQQFVGQVIALDVPIVNGKAHATVGDSKWRIKGPDLPAGTVVKVVDVDGNVLIVVEKESKTRH
jgi:membrane protein implicated in regulation of membrane protease activity